MACQPAPWEQAVSRDRSGRPDRPWSRTRIRRSGKVLDPHFKIAALFAAMSEFARNDTTCGQESCRAAALPGLVPPSA